MSRPQNKENLMSLADQLLWGMNTYGSMFNYETQTGALAEPVTASKGNGHVVAVYNSTQDILTWWIRGNGDTVWYRKGEETEASYIIWSDGLIPSTYYAKNGMSGVVEFSGTDAATVIQAALNGLTAGRTWKEKVVLKGGFLTDTNILLSSYTILELQGTLTLGDGSNCHVITNNDWGGGNTEIEVIGGKVEGNGAAQVGSFAGVCLRNVDHFRVADVFVNDTAFDGILIYNSSYGIIENIHVKDTGNHAIFVGYSSSYIVVDDIVSENPGTEHVCIEWTTGAAIKANYNHHIIVSNVVGQDAQGAGYYVQHAYETTLTNCIAKDTAGSSGFVIWTSEDILLIGCQSIGTTNVIPMNGFQIFSDTMNIQLSSCLARDSILGGGGVGFGIVGTDVTLSNCIADNNTSGFSVSSSSNRVVLTNCISKNAALGGYGFTLSGNTLVESCVSYNNPNGFSFGGTGAISVIGCYVAECSHQAAFVISNAAYVYLSGNTVKETAPDYPTSVIYLLNQPANGRVRVINNKLDITTDAAFLYESGNNAASIIEFKNNLGYIASSEERSVSGSLTAGVANAIAFAWNNPEKQDILIKKVVIEVRTAGGTAGSHLDVGIADDATGTNRGTEFFDDLLLNSVSINDSWVAGDGGLQTKWVFCQDYVSAVDDWVVGQILDADAASLVGKYYIVYAGR